LVDIRDDLLNSKGIIDKTLEKVKTLLSQGSYGLSSNQLQLKTNELVSELKENTFIKQTEIALKKIRPLTTMSWFSYLKSLTCRNHDNIVIQL